MPYILPHSGLSIDSAPGIGEHQTQILGWGQSERERAPSRVSTNSRYMGWGQETEWARGRERERAPGRERVSPWTTKSEPPDITTWLARSRAMSKLYVYRSVCLILLLWIKSNRIANSHRCDQGRVWAIKTSKSHNCKRK